MVLACLFGAKIGPKSKTNLLKKRLVSETGKNLIFESHGCFFGDLEVWKSFKKHCYYIVYLMLHVFLLVDKQLDLGAPKVTKMEGRGTQIEVWGTKKEV